jgi:predicted Rossmann fold nucleotide-binding protein DprA/Smf involved in DNA uptake
VGGTIVTLDDEIYPSRLENIYDPPPMLYMRGQLRKEDELLLPSWEAERPHPMAGQ